MENISIHEKVDSHKMVNIINWICKRTFNSANIFSHLMFCCGQKKYLVIMIYVVMHGSFHESSLVKDKREVADSHTWGIFIRDTAYFVVIPWTMTLCFIESQWNMPHPVWKCFMYSESATSIMCFLFLFCFFILFIILWFSEQINGWVNGFAKFCRGANKRKHIERKNIIFIFSSIWFEIH